MKYIVLSIACTLLLSGVEAKQFLSKQKTAKKFIVKPQEVISQPYAGAFFESEMHDPVEIPNVGQVAGVSFLAKNFSPNDTFVVASQNLGGAMKPLFNYKVDDDGYLGREIPEGTIMIENDVHLLFNYFKGEPVRFWLLSKNGKIKMSKLIIPYPNKASFKDGAEVSIRRLTPDARLNLCEGSKFLPGEVVYVSSKSQNVVVRDVPVVCHRGVFSIALEPEIDDEQGGVAYLSIRRKNELIMLEYEWGYDAVDRTKLYAPSEKMDPDALKVLTRESEEKELKKKAKISN